MNTILTLVNGLWVFLIFCVDNLNDLLGSVFTFLWGASLRQWDYLEYLIFTLAKLM